MDYELKDNGGEIIVSLAGSLSFIDNESVRAIIGDVRGRQAKTVTFDLAGLEKLDSVGLGLLLIVKEEFESLGISLRLSDPRAAVKRLFEIADMGRHFVIV
ncbi:STAS domain-containing protein [Magnetospirillum sp. UT-4]|uniref:STAS domain-containing protein n=1 Tax=Magnetospirillum sp. UT-4 TaxID=2681467 RepID=UPI00137CC4A1|nr:STAS domain-containing protein [Magnetospirillum sp. UT-4]CAA7613898.1 Anti-anti-sigma regulatory factor [Magnetospirillum sp. UT-4]